MKNRIFVILLCVLAVVLVGSQYFYGRYDLTADKRYTLSQPVKALLKTIDQPVRVTLFLDGELNSGFLQLQEATLDLLDEFEQYVSAELEVEIEDPNGFSDADKRQFAEVMYRRGFKPTEVNERDRDGKLIKQTLFPIAEIAVGEKSQWVSLLLNVRGRSGAENLNASIENLEYTLSDALRQLTSAEVSKIVFLEGHDEIPEPYIYDAELALSRYFQIDRGSLTDSVGELDGYKAVVVAAPQSQFSEADKYVIDQYIMQGGNVLWVIDGVMLSEDGLSEDGYTPAIPLDVNLTDMLFRYGMRVNPVLVQDQQCLSVPVNMSSDPSAPDYQPMPFYYAPVLLTSFESPITKNVTQVMSSFVSTVDFVGDGAGQKRDLLLATSNASRLVPVPAKIDVMELDLEQTVFQYAYMPVAVSIEGKFESLFAHRVKPIDVKGQEALLAEGQAKQVLVGSGSVVRNDMQKGEPLPVGYDRMSNMMFGNRDFITNAVLYLADSEGWIQLRNKEIKLRMLNTNVAIGSRGRIQAITIIAPVLILALIGACVFWGRKKRYRVG
ncbi:MAG: gliding motility-associated ABC transporter substrate-binding protein GldG [Paludibacteraceae bacterium]|nr:gliding motility-associated ABC transporter substrate-binding protein GldG [Paludibacteraceae bacterium]